MNQRRYWIRLRGFDGHEVIAPNAAKAKFKTFRSWREAGYGPGRYSLEPPFKYFLSQIEVLRALGEAGDLDPRTPEFGAAP